MELGVSIPHSVALSNNPYPYSNHQYLVLIPIRLRYFLILSFHLGQGIPESLYPIALPVQFLKALPPSSFWLHDLPPFIF